MKKFLILYMLLLGCTIGMQAQETIEITGVVVDNKKEPMPGVTVSVSEVAGLGVITDNNGRYKIKVTQYRTLVFSYIGYANQEVLLKEQRTVDVTMHELQADIFDDVVITGTGAQKKVTLSGAITQVDVKLLKSNPSGSISSSLIGNAPGVLGMQTSGKPGSSSDFWIRSIGTFGASNKALVIVDGFERNLDEINAEDIKDFSILKDASATAIYGSKGANGVIIINTKRGSMGKIDINAKVEMAYNTLTKVPDFVDGYRYSQLMNEARITRNQEPMMQPDELEILRKGLDPDLYPNVDWKKQLLRDGAMTRRASLSFNGGGSTARYYVSTSFVDQEGMFKVDDSLKDYNTNANYSRWNYRLNTDINVTSSTILKVGVSGSLEKFNDVGLGNDALWWSIVNYTPILTPLVYSNGYIPAYGIGNQTNPWVQSTMTGYRENWKNNIQTNATLEQNFDFVTPGLRFVARFGYDTNNDNWIDRKKWPEQWKAQRFRDTKGELVFDRISTEGAMYQESGGGGGRNEFFESEFHYDRGFGAHNIGGTVKYSQAAKIQTVGVGTDLKTGVARRNQGLAGRLTYRWNSRYFAEFNFGYSGSENFAKGHKFGFFPAVSGGWNVAEETFVRNNLKWVNMFKIRYSYGRVGNDNLGDNRFPYLYTIDNTGGYQFADYGFNKAYAGKHYSQVSSPNITWEIATKHDLGLDISLFGDKVSATVDYFNEKRTGIYMNRNFLPNIVGLESVPSANVGSVKTQGFDGNFTVRHKVNAVDLTLRGNMTVSKNEILERDEEDRYYTYMLDKGHRVDQARGLISMGLFKDYDDIRNSPRQDFGTVMPGDIKYKDVNGDGVVNGDDRVAIGATTRPNLVFGMGATAVWRNMDVNIHFQGSGKSSYFINGPSVFLFSEGAWGNVLTGIADSNRWISSEISGNPATEDPNAEYPRLSYGGNNNNQQGSDYWLRNGSYVRLKTVEMGYSFPRPLVNKFNINNARLFFVATNILTWSSFKLWDPEMGSSNGAAYPLSKTFSLGLTINL